MYQARALFVPIALMLLSACGGGSGADNEGGRQPDPPQPRIAATVLAEGEVGTPYPVTQLTVANGTEPYRFALTAGDLPSGLSLDPDGTIAGTPTTHVGSPFSFTVEVSDDNAMADSAQLSITIRPMPPSLDSAPLPFGRTGTPYAPQQLTVTGGIAPFNFSLAAGSLPDDLELSTGGLISGTPSNDAGSPYTFDVQVTDAGGNSDTASFSIAIEPRPGLTTGLQSMESQGQTRSFYIRVPDDYSPLEAPKPVLFAFHGTDGSHQRWLPGGLYGDGILSEIGDEAILVFPDATPVGTAPVRQFSRDSDGQFFLDLLTHINERLEIDEDRVFVIGQSSGAGFAHQLGCEYGDLIRGIAPAAGAIIPRTCVGSTAVMMIVGETDQLVPLTLTQPSRQFWVAYNGFDLPVSQASPIEQCLDHSLGASDYPVYWCQHPGEGPRGHSFPGFAPAAIWQFFSGLPQASPGTDAPPGGGNDRVASTLPTTLTVTLDFPATIGPVYRMAVALYQEGWRPGTFSAPIFFLKSNPDFEPVIPGASQILTTPINLPPDAGPPFEYPGTYVIAISIYVVGGSYPIPLSGVDHFAWYETVINDPSTPIVIPEPVIVEAYP